VREIEPGKSALNARAKYFVAADGNYAIIAGDLLRLNKGIS
jgi:hypothetical protein